MTLDFIYGVYITVDSRFRLSRPPSLDPRPIQEAVEEAIGHLDIPAIWLGTDF